MLILYCYVKDAMQSEIISGRNIQFSFRNWARGRWARAEGHLLERGPLWQQHPWAERSEERAGNSSGKKCHYLWELEVFRNLPYFSLYKRLLFVQIFCFGNTVVSHTQENRFVL